MNIVRRKCVLLRPACCIHPRIVTFCFAFPAPSIVAYCSWLATLASPRLTFFFKRVNLPRTRLNYSMATLSVTLSTLRIVRVTNEVPLCLLCKQSPLTKRQITTRYQVCSGISAALNRASFKNKTRSAGQVPVFTVAYNGGITAAKVSLVE